MRLAADFRMAARERLRGKWGVSIAVSLVAALLGGGSTGGLDINYSFDSSSQGLFENNALNLREILTRLNFPEAGIVALLPTLFTISIIFAIIAIALGGAAQLGRCSYYTKLMAGGSPEFMEVFSGFRQFVKALLLNLYMSLLVFLWLLLLIVPGIVAMYRYRLAFYLMAEYPDMGVMECVSESKRLMEGHKGRLFCLDFSFIGWWLLSMLTFGIGLLWLNPYIGAADAAFYVERTGDRISGNGPAYGAYEPEFVVRNGPEQL